MNLVDIAYRALRERGWAVRIYRNLSWEPSCSWFCDINQRDGRGWVGYSACSSRDIAILVAVRMAGLISYEAYRAYFNARYPDDPLDEPNGLQGEALTWADRGLLIRYLDGPLSRR
jgi:hypothetical protein